jgi:hypothetical protein
LHGERAEIDMRIRALTLAFLVMAALAVPPRTAAAALPSWRSIRQSIRNHATFKWGTRASRLAVVRAQPTLRAAAHWAMKLPELREAPPAGRHVLAHIQRQTPFDEAVVTWALGSSQRTPLRVNRALYLEAGQLHLAVDDANLFATPFDSAFMTEHKRLQGPLSKPALAAQVNELFQGVSVGAFVDALEHALGGQPAQP